MKQYTIFRFISLLLFPGVLVLASCNDDSDKEALDVSGAVKINTFSANGVDGIFDETTKPSTIKLYLPWSSDLNNLATEVHISEGATISPTIDSNVDLSAGKTYRLYNGNLYNDYIVSAAYSSITSFKIETYSGTIDEGARTITIKYPSDMGVSSLRPIYTTTPGAVVSPESGVVQDFSNPVEYTVSYMGESVKYMVTVEPTNFSPVGFVGTASSASDIENEDEKSACDWFINNVPNAEYISFDDIKAGNISLNEYSVIWWHLDGSSRDLPTIATSSEVLTPIKNYFNNGGSLFLSSWAVKYAATIGAANDNKEANNLWGETNEAEAVTLSDDWGICFTGHESHPVFQGLTLPSGVDNKVYLLSAGLKVRAHNAVWNFAESWVEYQSKSAWQNASGGVGLASFHWDDGNESRAVMFEYPATDTKGGVVCIGGEAYDWNVVGTNAYQSNLKKLTTNIIEYLQK